MEQGSSLFVSWIYRQFYNFKDSNSYNNDYSSNDGAMICKDTNCAILPVGFLLLAVDCYFDFQWILFPSKQTAQMLRNYYICLLTPNWWLLWPGYWFPIYVVYKLCWQCPTIPNFVLLTLWLPIALRYVGILRFSTTERLQHWWTVVGLRIALAVTNVWAIQAHAGVCNNNNNNKNDGGSSEDDSCGCSWRNVPAFLMGRQQ